MKLSYSSYHTYLKCPRMYINDKNDVPPPTPSSKYFALYGLLIEMFFTKYTNHYTKRRILLSDADVHEILEGMWEKILNENYVCWTDPWVNQTSGQILQSVYEDVLKNMKTFDFWKEARSEVTIDISLKKTQDLLTSRLDFIWEKPNGEVEILDGKGTNKLDTNVDVEQLLFYGLLYLLRYSRLPTKLGFLYYKYQIIKYIDFDMKSILDFKDKVSIVKAAIKKDTIYTPKVKLSKQCQWCEYKYTCDAFAQKRTANAEKSAAKKAALETVDSLIDFAR